MMALVAVSAVLAVSVVSVVLVVVLVATQCIAATHSTPLPPLHAMSILIKKGANGPNTVPSATSCVFSLFLHAHVWFWWGGASTHWQAPSQCSLVIFSWGVGWGGCPLLHTLGQGLHRGGRGVVPT